MRKPESKSLSAPARATASSVHGRGQHRPAPGCAAWCAAPGRRGSEAWPWHLAVPVDVLGRTLLHRPRTLPYGFIPVIGKARCALAKGNVNNLRDSFLQSDQGL